MRGSLIRSCLAAAMAIAGLCLALSSTPAAADDGARIKALAFRAAQSPLGQALLAAGPDTRLHVAGTLGLDHYQGQASVQLRVTDAAPAPA